MHRHHHHGPWRGGWGRGPFIIRRGNGLLGDLLAGGIGYMIGRQQVQNQPYQQYSGYDQQGAPQSQGNTQSNQLAQLKLLGELRESGVLTEEEFQVQKRRILQNS